MKILAVVPARAGSRGLPDKNVLELGGVPLWRIAVNQAVEAGVTQVVVSTNDWRIMASTKGLPANVALLERPMGLCTDSSPVEEAIRHALGAFKDYDVLVMLNPTHPFRRIQDIQACIQRVAQGTSPSCAAVREDYSYTVEEGSQFESMNRQERIPRMVVTGSIYAVSVPVFLETGKLMRQTVYGSVGSWIEVLGPYIDLDSPMDYEMAISLWRSRVCVS